MRCLLPLSLVCVLLPALTVRAEGEALEPRRPFSVAPAPGWVQPVSLTPGPPEVTPEPPVRLRLFSEQIRVTPETVEAFRRVVKTFSHPAGVERGATHAIDFDPTWQRLILHGVWLERDGRRTSVFDPAGVRVIQQERAPEERRHVGRLRALVSVTDVRVGDSVEYAYTLEGQNPLLGGRFASQVPAAFDVPLDHWRLRLLAPVERAIASRSQEISLQPVVTETAGLREQIWEQEQIAAVQPDDALPAWFAPHASLELSEFTDWASVARWAAAVYVTPAEVSPILARERDRLARLPSREAKLVATLRFVQEEIRTLERDPGVPSQRPRAAADTLERRAGDGKDKAVLLVALLRSLGIDAHAALVHTRAMHRLEERLPSPALFDHAIVRARLGERTLWIDPSATHERGGVEELIAPPFRRALVVDAESDGLAELPLHAPLQPETEIEETYLASDRAAPVKLSVTTRHSGLSANRMRRRLATLSPTELGRELQNHYARVDTKIRALKPLEVRDDPVRNVLTLIELYAIEDFWKDGRRDLFGHEVARHLEKPRLAQRAMPLALAHPVHVKHLIRLEPPARLEVAPDVGFVESEEMRVDYSFRGVGSTVLLEFTYRSLADAVSPEALPQYLDTVKRVSDHLGYWVRLDSGEARVAAPSKDRGRPAFFLPVFLFILLVLFAVASGAFRARRQPPLTEPPAAAERRAALRPDAEPGETAATALHVASLDDQTARLQQRRCACGTRGTGADTAVLEIPLVLAGREITAVKWRCPTCGTARAAYFTRDAAQAA